MPQMRKYGNDNFFSVEINLIPRYSAKLRHKYGLATLEFLVQLRMQLQRNAKIDRGFAM